MERLLVLTLVAAGSCSGQHLQSLKSYVNGAVLEAIEPHVVKLAGSLEEISSRLVTLDNRLDTLDSRVDVLDSRLDGFDLRIDGLVTQLTGKDSRLDSFESRLDGLVTQVTGENSRLDGFESRLDGLVTQLTGEDSRLDGFESRLDGLVTQLTGKNSRLDGFESRLDELTSEVSRLNSSEDSLVGSARTPGESPVTRDCSDLPAGSKSGVYSLQLPGPDQSEPVSAYCDMQTDQGNWTVIQRRADFQPRQDFFLGWDQYKEGFGDVQKEFWWGLQNIWLLTSRSDRSYELRIDMEDGGEKRHAVYQHFRVSSESDGYRLSADEYSGDAGDSLKYHVGHRFSTKDRDQDEDDDRHCADKYKGAWWYNSCHQSNLNAQYLAGPAPEEDGINWKTFKGYKHSLEKVEMKIRPV